MYSINSKLYRASAYDRRIRFLVLHYTALNFVESVQALANHGARHQVSAHYLIPDPEDPSYKAAHSGELEIFNLVAEEDRAWHAGLSGWEDRRHINDQSIGIELVNLASYSEAEGFTFPDYHPQQVEALIQLCQAILARYPAIKPTRILGHADVAPGRKQDPGPRFPWHRLYRHGIGAWYEEAVKDQYIQHYQASGLPDILGLQQMLGAYGYHLPMTGLEDSLTRDCVRSFQMHFRPDSYDGCIDVETVAILSALLARYKDEVINS